MTIPYLFSIAPGTVSGISSSIITGEVFGAVSTPEGARKVRENRLRRAAQRQGLLLEKSRARDPRALDFGTYHLRDGTGKIIAKGSTRAAFGLNLDQIEARLTGN
ncbi:hypothetical protein ABZS77_29600 [Micromonospora sp. NPDC005298]|uniref:hypothetical protein n=1 Tax=Micromonospora sp. NPDC005298 TaxID=3156873 RepID=UPI0033B33168